jgi:hypothetical protein
MYKVEYIIDTRSYDLETGKPIPGTGDARSCEFCGATHEIHCYVRNSKTNELKICGSTCLRLHTGIQHKRSGYVAPLRIGAMVDEFGREYWSVEALMQWGEWREIDRYSNALDIEAAKVAHMSQWKGTNRWV